MLTLPPPQPRLPCTFLPESLCSLSGSPPSSRQGRRHGLGWPAALGATFPPALRNVQLAATSVHSPDSHSDAAYSQAPPDGIISRKGLLDNIYAGTALGSSSGTGEGGKGEQRAALVSAPCPTSVPRMGQTNAEFSERTRRLPSSSQDHKSSSKLPRRQADPASPGWGIPTTPPFLILLNEPEKITLCLSTRDRITQKSRGQQALNTSHTAMGLKSLSSAARRGILPPQQGATRHLLGAFQLQ